MHPHMCSRAEEVLPFRCCKDGWKMPMLDYNLDPYQSNRGCMKANLVDATRYCTRFKLLSKVNRVSNQTLFMRLEYQKLSVRVSEFLILQVINTITFSNFLPKGHANGLRICDVLEVLSCKTCNSGCFLDGERIWTSTPCASGEADLCMGEYGIKHALEAKLSIVIFSQISFQNVKISSKNRYPDEKTNCDCNFD